MVVVGIKKLVSSHLCIYCLLSSSSQQEHMDRAVFYRIIDDHDDNNNNNIEANTGALHIRITDNIVYATSRTLYYRRPIPAGGLSLDDLREMRLRLNGPSVYWIAEQLNRPEYGGVAGADVAGLASFLYGIDLDSIVDEIFRQHPRILQVPEVLTVPEVVPLLTTVVVVETVPQDYTCVVCQLTAGETPTNEEWVTAAGCSLHFVHRMCMVPWTRGTCMTCRAPLRSA